MRAMILTFGFHTPFLLLFEGVDEDFFMACLFFMAQM
jgi:hypothetical protein